MDRTQRAASLIDLLGEEILRIIAPVSACMFLVVLLVAVLHSDDSLSSSQSVTSIATIAYDESISSSDSLWDKLKGALLNALVFISVVTIVTFVLVFLFYIRCTKFLKFYMGFSTFMVLGFMGGEIALSLIKNFTFPIDCVTFFVLLVNFSVVGTLAVLLPKMPISVTQAYMVVIGTLVAYWFTRLPEWTTWVLLVAMALYDLAAVLLPVGPLRLLVELAISRDEDIPALVYEARPVVDESSLRDNLGQTRWRVRDDDRDQSDNAGLGVNSNDISNPGMLMNQLVDPVTSPENGLHGRSLVNVEEGRVLNSDPELSTPLLEQRMVHDLPHGQVEGAISDESFAFEGIGLGSTGAIKLGLGDFIFYSVLVGRAAMYDLLTVYACYLAIIAGLGITLMLLAVYQKALPALPVSVMLGVVFYFLARFLLEEFIVQCSMNLVMF